MRRAMLIALALAALPASAQSFYFSPDVPVSLGGTSYMPWDVVRDDSTGSYATNHTLPAGSEIDGLYRETSGAWLYSFKQQVSLSGTNFYAEDVVRYDTATGYTLYFDGSTHMGAANWNVDAVFLDGADLVLSFDVPATLGGVTYDASDLVRYSGGTFSSFFDASVAGIPSASNVTGADRDGALTVVTFDSPTTVGAATYLPGQLVFWNGASLGPHYTNAGWPIAIRVNAFAFVPGPGAVGMLTIAKAPLAPGLLQLQWTPSCSSGADDYGIYEGTIGDWGAHVPLDCFDDGNDLTETITPTGTMNYYLVVPRSSGEEGSYGVDSNLVERSAAGAAACATVQRLGTCTP